MSDAGAGASVRIEAPDPVLGLALVDGGQALCGFLAGMRLARWSCADGRLQSDLTYRGPPVSAARLTARGDRLAVASSQGAVRVLDARTLSVTAEMRLPPPPPVVPIFSSDGVLLAGFGRGRHLELKVWNVATGAVVCAFADPTEEGAGVAFHPSGSSASVALRTGDVLLLDLASGRPIRTLSDAQMASEALAFSADGAALVAASYDGILQVWETTGWRVRRHTGVPGAKTLAISPDGARVAVARSSYNPDDTPAQVRVVDLRTGAALASTALGIASSIGVTFTGPDRVRVATARGNSIALRDLE